MYTPQISEITIDPIYYYIMPELPNGFVLNREKFDKNKNIVTRRKS